MKLASSHELNRAFEAVKAGNVVDVLQKMSQELSSKELASDIRVSTLVNRACLNLALQTPARAMNDCDAACKLRTGYPLGHLIKGIAALWCKYGGELDAVDIWSQGMECECSPDIYFLLSTLLSDHNMRAWLLLGRFDVTRISEMLANWWQLPIYTDLDNNAALLRLRDGNAGVKDAIVFFSQIIAATGKPNGYFGRGAAHCLSGNWNEAIEDLSIVLDTLPMDKDALKFRAVAFSGNGQNLRAIADLAAYEAIGPADEDVLRLRARVELSASHYEIAMTKFNSADQSLFTNNDWLSFAQCLCEFGMYEEALKAIEQCTDATGCTAMYTRFLIYRGIGDRETAKSMILQAISVGGERTTFLSRMATEFFVDIGDVCAATAKFSHRIACVDTRFACACALAMAGQLLMAVETILPFVARYYRDMRIESDRDKMDIFRNGTCLYSTWMGVLREYESPITTMVRYTSPPDTLLDDFTDKKCSFKLTRLEITPTLTTMLNDADRIGSTCNTQSPILGRALGFCVLRIVALLKGNEPMVWRNVLKEIELILSFADWRYEMNDGRSTDSPPESPAGYYVVRNSRVIRRFRAVREMIYDVMKDRSPKFRAISECWTKCKSDGFLVGEMVVGSEEVAVGRGGSLDGPIITVENSGSFGYDIGIWLRSSGQEQWTKYETAIGDLFSQLRTWACDDFVTLSRLVLFIWMQHPLAHCNEELGYIIINSVFLFYNKQVKSIDPDIFVKRLVDASPSNLQRDLLECVLKGSKSSPVHPSSVDFWRHLPSNGNMVQLLIHSFVHGELNDSYPWASQTKVGSEII